MRLGTTRADASSRASLISVSPFLFFFFFSFLRFLLYFFAAFPHVFTFSQFSTVFTKVPPVHIVTNCHFTSFLHFSHMFSPLSSFSLLSVLLPFPQFLLCPKFLICSVPVCLFSSLSSIFRLPFSTLDYYSLVWRFLFSLA